MSDLFDDNDVPAEIQRDRVIQRQVPFIQIPLAVVRKYGRELGPCGIAVYVALKSYANRDSRQCFLLVKTISEELAMGESTVRRELSKLVQLGLIERHLREGRSSILVLSADQFFADPTPLPNSALLSNSSTPLLDRGTPLLDRGSPLLGRDITRLSYLESLKQKNTVATKNEIDGEEEFRKLLEVHPKPEDDQAAVNAFHDRVMKTCISAKVSEAEALAKIHDACALYRRMNDEGMLDFVYPMGAWLRKGICNQNPESWKGKNGNRKSQLEWEQLPDFPKPV